MRRLFALLVLVVLVVIAFFMVDIRKTEDGVMPQITVDRAKLPKFDVDMGSIEVHKEQKTVNVPGVEVTTKERQITVPSLEVNQPGEKNE